MRAGPARAVAHCAAMRVPPEVERFLRDIAGVRNDELMIEPLSVEQAEAATEALWRDTTERVDCLPEDMGLFVLTADSDPFGYGTRGAAAGKVMKYPHDATAYVAFSSLEAFGRALREAVANGTPIWDLPTEQATQGDAGPDDHLPGAEGLSLPTAESFLHALAAAPLFTRVGQPLPAEWNALAITSWKDALNGKRIQHKDNQHLEARNYLTSFLSDHHPEDRRWNDLTRKWSPQVKAIVTPACEELVRREGLESSPLSSIRWDCVAACMEYEYAHLRRPGFYQRVVGFYLAGHFPCGYYGWYPDGQHEIF
jgi:hypothetical protein